jgi:hypothetical protein
VLDKRYDPGRSLVRDRVLAALDQLEAEHKAAA